MNLFQNKVNVTFKNFMVQSGIRQKQVAAMTGYTTTYVSRIVCGWVVPSKVTIEHLCKSLKCQPSDIGFVYYEPMKCFVQNEYFNKEEWDKGIQKLSGLHEVV